MNEDEEIAFESSSSGKWRWRKKGREEIKVGHCSAVELVYRELRHKLISAEVA